MRARKFDPPSLEEVQAYCQERGNQVDPERFLAHYQSNGWRVGRNPMKDWKAAVRTWERNGYSSGNGQAPPPAAKRKPYVVEGLSPEEAGYA